LVVVFACFWVFLGVFRWFGLGLMASGLPVSGAVGSVVLGV
jgi:hypothetical protein